MTETWTAVCSSSIAALEASLELEPLAAQNSVELHWPKGKSMQLVGEAKESQFRINIRRDCDWFAAKGELKFDKDLSLEMMQLVDLVSQSPGRFVKLDDGRFLALTASLRSRIEDLRVYGNGRSGKGKLQFSAVHA